jgi:hypothetical protein
MMRDKVCISNYLAHEFSPPLRLLHDTHIEFIQIIVKHEVREQPLFTNIRTKNFQNAP